MSLVETDWLIPHEEVVPQAEERVHGHITRAGFFAWPVIADRATGLIIDGTHRYAAVTNRLAGRYILVQKIDFLDKGVEIKSWCRVIGEVSEGLFQSLRERHSLLEATRGLESKEHTYIFWGGRTYTFDRDRDINSQFAGAYRLEREVVTGAIDPHQLYRTEEEALAYVGEPETLVIVTPTLTKEQLMEMAGRRLLPPKSTRFTFPFRVIGLRVSTDLLTRAAGLEVLNRELDRHKAGPIRCLGRGAVIDRVYEEELYVYEDYSIPREFFRSEIDYQEYLSKIEGTASLVA